MNRLFEDMELCVRLKHLLQLRCYENGVQRANTPQPVMDHEL